MYKNCKTEQSAARQRELEQFLLKEMLIRHFDDISISDLCDGIGIPRKAFYRYFSGKRGALHALIDHTLMDLDNQTVELIHGNVPDQRRFLEIYLRFWREQKFLLSALDRSGLWEELVARMVDYALADLERTYRFSVESTRLERMYQCYYSVYGLLAIVQAWYHRGFSESPDEMALIVTKASSQPLPFSYYK